MKPLLSVQNLSIHIDVQDKTFKITDNINFDIQAGEIVSIVGESGCGKTITALSILKLLPVPGGRISNGKVYFEDKNLLELSNHELLKIRGKDISIIFQEPSTSLNPLFTIGRQLFEVAEIHAKLENQTFTKVDKEKIKIEICSILESLGLSDFDRILAAYPHQLSGGMVQRVMIAMALLLKPKLLIADEPTTALDVTIQAQIMDSIHKLSRQSSNKMAVLLITHNLALVAQYADTILVMYAGRIVESAKVKDFLANPLHPYSKGLIGAFPDLSAKNSFHAIEGTVLSPLDYDEGCRFRERCLNAMPNCVHKPTVILVHNTSVYCHLYDQEKTRFKNAP